MFAQPSTKGEKTVGGIKIFAGNKISVLKWCLNRAEQANNYKALSDIATDAGLYKPLKPSQVLQTNERVNRIVKVLNEDYINPFGLDIEKDSLINVSSGVPQPDAIANDILSIKNVGSLKKIAFLNLNQQSFTFQYQEIKSNVSNKVK